MRFVRKRDNARLISRCWRGTKIVYQLKYLSSVITVNDEAESDAHHQVG